MPVPDPTQTVHVNLAERSYDIRIGAGNLDQAGRWLASLDRVSHAVVITDENVEEPHGVRVGERLAAGRPRRLMSNSFAFGGNNACLILGDAP